MKEPNPTRWAGVCAGGYFAAAAVYVGNICALVAFRAGAPWLTLLMGGLPLVCMLMGGLVLTEKPRAPRWAVVVAGGFSAIHLVGLADLFLTGSAPDSALARSLQWQLGVALLFLWLGVLFSAFRLARCADSSRQGPVASGNREEPAMPHQP
jgi:hypothetical protein